MAGELTRSGRDRARRKTPKRSTLDWQSHSGQIFSVRFFRFDSDHVRFWSEPVAQTARKQARLKINTVFLRDECVLPSQFDLLQEPFCKGWAEAIGTAATELDATIRGVGWHFMWIVDSHASLALGRTADAAIHRALARALPVVKRRFNAAELDSIHVTNFPGFRLARVSVQARQIQSQASLN